MKKLTQRMLNNGKYILFSMLLISCSSVEIYFDKESQSITRCGNNGIHSLTIYEVIDSVSRDKLQEYFLNESNVRPSSIKIKDIYKIFNFKDSIIFKPNTKYIIIHTGIYDEGSDELEVYTDSKGYFYKASKYECEGFFKK
jgi:hypothetical protein